MIMINNKIFVCIILCIAILYFNKVDKIINKNKKNKKKRRE